MSIGSLVVVGTGIQLVGHLTLTAQAWIEQADKVLFAVSDPLTARWLQTLNPTAEALPYLTDRQRRRETYQELAVTPNMQGAFVKNPEALMDVAGLSQKTALASRDRAIITALFADEFSQAGYIYMDPGPDPPRPSEDEEK